MIVVRMIAWTIAIFAVVTIMRSVVSHTYLHAHFGLDCGVGMIYFAGMIWIATTDD